MKYEYVFAAGIRGLLSEEEDATAAINIPGAHASIVYTKNRYLIPEAIDLRTAIGTQLLGVLGGKAIQSHELMHLVASIRQRRQDEDTSEMLALLKITGDTKDFELQHSREEEKYIVCLGDSPEKDIKDSYKPHIQSLLIALNLSSPTPVQTRNLIESVIFYRNDGKPIFCYEFQGRATIFSASRFSQLMAEEVSSNIENLLRQNSLTTVFRLLRQSMDMGSDNLLSFLSAWTALEILVRKIAQEYPALNATTADKPTLTNQFAAISDGLCKSDAAEDMKLFSQAKKTRDKFVHGENIQIELLPSEATRNLVSKYLRLHLGYTSAQL